MVFSLPLAWALEVPSALGRDRPSRADSKKVSFSFFHLTLFFGKSNTRRVPSRFEDTPHTLKGIRRLVLLGDL